MRVAAVPAAALDPHLDLVGGGVDEAAARGDGAGRHAGMHVRGDDVRDLVLLQRPFAQHVERAGGVGLLPRLQQRHEPDRQLEAGGCAQQRHERGLVHVVAAGVHGAVGRREAGAGALGHGERVELGAQRHRRAAGGADPPDRAGAGHGQEVQHALELVRDAGGRVVLVARQARLGVQLAPQPLGGRQLPIEGGAPPRRELGQARHVGAHAPSVPASAPSR